MHEDGIGMARTFEVEFHGRTHTPTGAQRGFFAAVERPAPQPAPPTPPCARLITRSLAPGRTRGSPSRATRPSPYSPASSGAASSPRSSTAAARRRARAAGDQRVLRRQHGGDRADHRRAIWRRAADQPEGHRYLLPDVCRRRGSFPRRAHGRRTAPPRGGRAHRRHRAAQSPGRPRDGTATPMANEPTPDIPRSRATTSTSRSRGLPTVVIIGRPNVGKSTLFNRIVGSQVAIVEDRPGITRDRKESHAEWLGHAFLLVDTGGWMPGGDDARGEGQPPGRGRGERRRRGAVRRRRVGRAHRRRLAIANWLRSIRRPVLVVANKSDNERRETETWEFLALGLGEPVPVSALHGRRAGDLLDQVLDRFPDRARRSVGGRRRSMPTASRWTPRGRAMSTPPRVAIVGRPNVGKITLFNRLVGEDRAVVHDLAGTTRDRSTRWSRHRRRADRLRRHS